VISVFDTSAFIAIIKGEPEMGAAIDAIADATTRLVSRVSVMETRMVLAGRGMPRAVPIFERLLAQHGFVEVDVDGEQARAAEDGRSRYGRGCGTQARTLNFGDLVSYAAAKVSGGALVYKGDDFGVTDVKLMRIDVP
jgi:ribonuclease VapC